MNLNRYIISTKYVPEDGGETYWRLVCRDCGWTSNDIPEDAMWSIGDAVRWAASHETSVHLREKR